MKIAVVRGAGIRLEVAKSEGSGTLISVSTLGLEFFQSTGLPTTSSAPGSRCQKEDV